MPTYNEKTVKPFIDSDGRLCQYPAKRGKQVEVLRYLATKLEAGRTYTENEVNDIIRDWHTFNDHCQLRRDMCDARIIHRAANGSAYTLAPDEEQSPESEAQV